MTASYAERAHVARLRPGPDHPKFGGMRGVSMHSGSNGSGGITHTTMAGAGGPRFLVDPYLSERKTTFTRAEYLELIDRVCERRGLA